MSLFPFIHTANRKASPKQKRQVTTLLKIAIYSNVITIASFAASVIIDLLTNPHSPLLWNNSGLAKTVHLTSAIPFLTAVFGVTILVTFVSSIMVFVSASRVARDFATSTQKNRARFQPLKKGLNKQASFSDGVASILDFGNTLTRQMPGLTARQKDYLALRSDWAAVGDDLQVSIKKFEQDINQKNDEAKTGGG